MSKFFFTLLVWAILPAAVFAQFDLSGNSDGGYQGMPPYVNLQQTQGNAVFSPSTSSTMSPPNYSSPQIPAYSFPVTTNPSAETQTAINTPTFNPSTQQPAPQTYQQPVQTYQQPPQTYQQSPQSMQQQVPQPITSPIQSSPIQSPPQTPIYSVPQMFPQQQIPQFQPQQSPTPTVSQQQPVVLDAVAYSAGANPSSNTNFANNNHSNNSFAAPTENFNNANNNFNNANFNDNANVPVFEVPQFQTPDVSAVSQSAPTAANGLTSDTPLIAFHTPIGNAYGEMPQTGGTVPAFQSANSNALNVPESSSGLLASAEERPTDRASADRENYERWKLIREKKNTNAWMEPLPSYAGPLDYRTVGRPDDSSPLGNLLVSFHEEGAKQDEYAYEWEAEEKHYFDFSMLDPTRLGEHMKRWVGLGPSEEKAKKYFQEGLNLMQAEKFGKAADSFEWAAYYAPKTILEEDARYHAAECYYRSGRNYDAAQQYKRIIMDFPSSQYKSEVIKNLYEIAKTWIKQTEKKASYVNVTDKSRPTFDTFGHAKGALETIYINCPRDPLADDSVYLLAVSYMRRASKVQGDVNYEHAAECFKQLRDFYPNSEYIVDAMRWEAVCHKYASLGADYDAGQINQAGEIADQLLQQHATRLDSDAQNEILQVRNDVTESKAEKLWVTGQFYDVRKEYRAARLQYELLIEKFPSTKYAERAAKRIEQIRDLPPEPVSTLAKIKGIFVK